MPQGVYVEGSYAYVTNFTSATLQVFDVSNPAAPALVGSITTQAGTYSVYVAKRYAYVTNYSANSLQIIDVSNPASPTISATVSTGVNPPRNLCTRPCYDYVMDNSAIPYKYLIV